jgi:hypothetical protein
VLQIRRSTYHEVLKVNEAVDLLDVTGEAPGVSLGVRVGCWRVWVGEKGVQGLRTHDGVADVLHTVGPSAGVFMVVHISPCWLAAAAITHSPSNPSCIQSWPALSLPYLSPTSTLPPSSTPTGVQPYSINNNKVLFLRPRPQPRPPKGPITPGTNACAVDGRQLMDPGYAYCSIR